MNLNNLIPIQYEKIKKIENYKKKHKDTQLTHDTYRAVSLAYRTMINYRQSQENGTSITPEQRQKLAKEMAHSQDWYNQWLGQYGMSPSHNKSNETEITNSNMTVHVGRAIKTIYQHIVEIEHYLRRYPSDIFSQDTLNRMRNVHMEIEKFYDNRRGGQHLTMEQTNYIDHVLQSCNTSFCNGITQ